MKIRFYEKKYRVVTDITPISRKILDAFLDEHQPERIFHGGWSKSIPFIVITEYNEDGFKMFCQAWGDKEPQQYDSDKLYNFLRYQGLGECYFLTEPQTENQDL